MEPLAGVGQNFALREIEARLADMFAGGRRLLERDAVARDFDLSTDAASAAMTPAPNPNSNEKFDVAEALKTLATLADRLRQSESDLPKERKL